MPRPLGLPRCGGSQSMAAASPPTKLGTAAQSQLDAHEPHLPGPPTLNEWLALVVEEPLEPLLPIVDPHHHLWLDHPESFSMSQAGKLSFGGARSGFTKYMVPELLQDLAGNNVTHTVFLECHSFYDESAPAHLQPVGETRQCQAFADEQRTVAPHSTQVCAGIVSKVDLTLGRERVEESLDAHARCANFRGIRHSCSWAPDAASTYMGSPDNPELLYDAAFREGLACLAPRGLTFETWLFHLQLPALADLASAFPSQLIVCDHVAMPLGMGEPFAAERGWATGSTARQWREGMIELAKCPNVFVKLGGLTQPHAGHDFNLREKPPTSAELALALGPWYNFCIDAFGCSRCMFESNFPPDRASTSYTVLWNCFKRIAAGRGCSAAEMAQLFGSTAKRVYRLEECKL